MTLNICKSILPINSPSSASSLSFRMSRSQHFSKGLTGTWVWLGWVFLHDEFVSEIFWNTLGFPWIFHQPRFFWNKGISLPMLPFGVRSCEVAIIWPVYCIYLYVTPPKSNMTMKHHNFQYEIHLEMGWNGCFSIVMSVFEGVLLWTNFNVTYHHVAWLDRGVSQSMNASPSCQTLPP